MNRQRQLGQCLASLIDLFERRTTDTSGTVFISPQQPFADVAQYLWHLRQGELWRLRQLALLLQRGGQIEQLAKNNGWEREFGEITQSFWDMFTVLNRVRYHRSERPVELGDHIKFKFWFSKAEGRVSYVPGQSELIPEIDFNGIFRVGIWMSGDRFTALTVNADTLELPRHAVFVRHDTVAIPSLPSVAELRE